MSHEFDWKKFQFITMVQTALIKNMLDLESQRVRPELGENQEVDERGSKTVMLTLIDMDDAFYAAEHIPEDKRVCEAAYEFMLFACENLRPEGYKPDMSAWYIKVRD